MEAKLAQSKLAFYVPAALHVSKEEICIKLNDKIYEIYEAIQEQISFFKKMPVASADAKIGREGIIRGLEIALEKIIEFDSK
jgi:hypothetical protein